MARVLGWGAALDDDSQLPKLLESFERATTKMLDRWSIFTYEEPIQITSTSTSVLAHSASHSNSNLSTNSFDSNAKLNQMSYLRTTQHSINFHISNIIENDKIQNLVESTRILNDKISDIIHRVNKICLSFINPNNTEYLTKVETRSKLAKKRLDNFYKTLKLQLVDNTPIVDTPSTPPTITIASPSTSNTRTIGNNFNNNKLAIENNNSHDLFKRNSIAVPTFHNGNINSNSLNLNKLSTSPSSKALLASSPANAKSQFNLMNKILATTMQTPLTSLVVPKLGKQSQSATNLTNIKKNEFKVSRIYRTSKQIIQRSNRLKLSITGLISLIENYDFNTQQEISNEEDVDLDDEYSLDDGFDEGTSGGVDNEINDNYEVVVDDDNYSHFTFEIDDLNSSKYLNPGYMDLHSPSASSVSYNHPHSPHSPHSLSPHLIYNENLKFNLNTNCKLNCRHGAASTNNLEDINNENSILLCSKEDNHLRPVSSSIALNKRIQLLGSKSNNLVVSSSSSSTTNIIPSSIRPKTLLISNLNNDQQETIVICSSSHSSDSSSSSNDKNIENEDCSTIYRNANFDEMSMSKNTNTNIMDILSTSSSITCTFPQTESSAPLACEEQSRVSTPSNMSRDYHQEKQQDIGIENIKIQIESDENRLMPQIRVINSETPKHSGQLDEKKKLKQANLNLPSLIAYSNDKQKQQKNLFQNQFKPDKFEKSTNNLFLSPNMSSNIQLSSSSSNNNLSVKHDSQFLGLPPSPSGYSSSGSCYSKTPLPSPRISKKYSQGK